MVSLARNIEGVAETMSAGNMPALELLDLSTQKVFRSHKLLNSSYESVSTCEKSSLDKEVKQVIDAVSEFACALKLNLSDSISENELPGTVAGGLWSLLLSLDPETALHSRRVSQVASEIATKMGLGSQEVEDARVAGLLHDIGKLIVPQQILSAERGLSKSEWLMVRLHPSAGQEMIGNISEIFRPGVVDAVLGHHERLDGSGYPSARKESELSQTTKIVAVADAFDTLTSRRSYKPAMPVLEAVNKLLAEAGTLSDAGAVSALAMLTGIN